MQSLSTDSISEALLAARTGGVLDVTVDRKRYLLLGKRYMPKDFSNDFLSGFVGRVELPKCWQTIQEAASTENCATPGLYLAGPPGAGKSALLYFLVIEARRSGMIAPYIARCDEWAFMPVHRAMGFFLDAVADANTAVSEDPCSPIAIGRPPVTVGTNWETFASIPSYENRHKTVEDMFNWCALLLQETQSHPVVLFFDEQNALYERSIAGRPAIEMQPFQIADFLLTFARGCVVLSGTADNLHLYHLRSGHDKFVHHLGHLCDYDFHHWMDKSTQFGGLAAQMYRASTGAYADSVRKYIGAITGRIPRELVSYCQRQSTIAQPTTLSPYIINRYFVDLDKAYIRHHRKRVLNIFNHYFAEYPDRKVRVLERILEMFTKSRNEVDFDAPFLALGLIYETNGQPCFLTPATEGVLLQQVIYHTRADPRSPLHHIIAKYLTVLREPSRTEEEKGYAFEKLILLRLMQVSLSQLFHTIW
ncbi:hypothetical protein BC832DRAFT_565214 [Gaertneriomyces semiglobifer]|nr:hypothetical protein BC832DRAFT_565214 [Gaertneriomyces semiglobifer]